MRAPQAAPVAPGLAHVPFAHESPVPQGAVFEQVSPAELATVEQRRLVTALFVDLTGSTDMGEQLDPEALREVMQDYYSAMRERLVRAVRERSITTVFQPVIDLATGDVVGFEALSRGPKGTEIEKPEVIFELARDFDLVWDLESLCIENIQPMLADVCSRGLMAI